VASSIRLYVDHPRLFLGIGFLFAPLGLAITLLQYLIFEIGPLHPLVSSAGSSNAVVDLLAFTLGLFVTIAGLAVVQAVTAIAVVELDAGREIGPGTAYRMFVPRLRPLLAALITAAAVVAVCELTGIGLVVGVWLAIRWSLLAQAVILDDPEHPLRRSADLVHGHWWRTASITLFVTGIGLLLGPLAGTCLLFLSSASFDFVNLVSGLIYVVTLPLVAITTTYLYFDLAVRHRLEASEPVEAVLPAEI
jgi:hypothetical protein